MYSRRDFARGVVGLASLGSLSGIAAFARAQTTVGGVRLGMITGCLNPRPETPAGMDPIDFVAQQCADVGVTNIELVGTLLQPSWPSLQRGGRIPDPLTPVYIAERPQQRAWRLNTPLGFFTDVRAKFERRGLKIISYVDTFTSDFTDPEAEAVFRQAEALGAAYICTNQSQVSVGEHLVPIQARYKVKLAWHNHARVDDYDEVASVASLRRLMAMSPNYMINLDIGHFTAGDNDGLAFLREHHARISHVHFKDRKRDNGPNVEWGTGDTPIRQALQLIKQNRWPIYCVQEREFQGLGTPIEQTRRNFDFMRAALA